MDGLKLRLRGQLIILQHVLSAINQNQYQNADKSTSPQTLHLQENLTIQRNLPLSLPTVELTFPGGLMFVMPREREL